jgi:hypothetical protein
MSGFFRVTTGGDTFPGGGTSLESFNQSSMVFQPSGKPRSSLVRVGPTWQILFDLC